MITSEFLRLAGSAVKVADQAEELIEFIESLGPETLSNLTYYDEFLDFRDSVEEYIYVRENCDVEIEP